VLYLAYLLLLGLDSYVEVETLLDLRHHVVLTVDLLIGYFLDLVTLLGFNHLLFFEQEVGQY
jgi:hypothetical protein